MKKILYIIIFLFLFTLSGCYSCQSWNEFWGEPREAYPADKVFWDKDCRPIAKVVPVKAAPARVTAKPTVSIECDDSSAKGYYPCKGCSVVRLEKSMPIEVAMNTEFDYTINVINSTDYFLSDVVVTENLPDNFKLSDTNPKAKVDGGKLTFEIGMLGPQQTELITVSGVATSTGCVKSCATVTYMIPTCTSVKVVQPSLRLVKRAPSSVLLCDSIPVSFVVSNTGSGSSGDIKIEDILPAGLKTEDGKSKIAIDAGNLAAGRSKEFSVTLMAEKAGKYVNKAIASSSTGLKAEASTTTEVRQPILAIAKRGPEKRYLGLPVDYEITVTNKGNAPARSLVIEDKLPPGVKFISASNGGKASAGKVVWKLGTLAPKGSVKVSMKVMPGQTGTIADAVTATAICAESVESSIETSVAGIPAILLEVIDVDDPVEVGSQTTYVIKATNQGSSSDTNIRIVCELEDNEQYVSSRGATGGRMSDNKVVFDSLSSLAPQAEATWSVVVKAVKAGDVRFKVIMNTDQLDRSVEETEATHIYE